MERSLRRKVQLRLVLPCVALALLSALDRVNISFAATPMSRDLGLSPAVYGAGASLFFVGYLLFQGPSMAVLGRVRARYWIAGCVALWAGVAALMAVVRDMTGFYALRVLLGVGEAAFAPGMVFYLNRWVGPRGRAGAFAWPMLSIPLSIVVGGPLSGWLLSQANWLHLAPWRWMFLAEAAPAVVLAGISLAYFDNDPSEARWLTDEEKVHLAREQAAERSVVRPAPSTLVRLLRDPRLWLSALAWFTLLTGAYGLTFWLPTALHEIHGLTDLMVGTLTALPWAGVACGMVFNAWGSDRTGERIAHVAAPSVLAGVFLAAAGAAGPSPAGFICVVAMGAAMGAAQGAFWTVPLGQIGPDLSAEGIAVINMIGSLGGLVAPPLIGWVRQQTGSFSIPVYALAGLLAFGGAAIVLLPRLCPVARRPAADPA